MIEYALIEPVQARETEHVIFFKCAFQDSEERDFFGYLLFFPHPSTLKWILSLLEKKISELMV
jgi:hypothetical protein